MKKLLLATLGSFVFLLVTVIWGLAGVVIGLIYGRLPAMSEKVALA
jgi:hypothetical protein